MTIDEAIEQFKYDAKNNRVDLDISYAEENEQIAEWLEELKAYKEIGTVEECRNSVLYIEKAYTKAIDDFVQLVNKYDWNIRNRNENAFIYNAIDKLAEQLKEGGGQKWLNYLHVVLFVFVSKTKTFCGFRNQLEPLAWPC